MKFRKLPIEAIEYNGNNVNEIINFCKGAAYYDLENNKLFINTLEGDHEVIKK